MVSLHRAKMNECEEIHRMQIESFRALLDKYKDYNTNPAANHSKKFGKK